MYRRVLGIFFLLLFLMGVTGFEFITHTCSHSGLEYYSAFVSPKHRCGEQEKSIEKNIRCCNKTRIAEVDDCCKKGENSTVLVNTVSKSQEEHDCCSDKAELYKITKLSKASGYAGFPLLYPKQIERFETGDIYTVLNDLFSAHQCKPPDEKKASFQSLFCVFRI